MSRKLRLLALSFLSLATVLVTNVPALRAATYTPADFKPAEYSNIPTDAGTTGSRIVTLVIVVGAVLVLGYLIWGGIDIITAGGDSGKIEKARNKIMFAVIGLIVLASAWAIFTLVLEITFGGTDISLPTLK